MALTVASPHIGLQWHQQQQGYEYQPPKNNHQLNEQYDNEQQQIFSSNQQEVNNQSKFKNKIIQKMCFILIYISCSYVQQYFLLY